MSQNTLFFNDMPFNITKRISEDQIYGRWLMDRPMEAPVLAAHTKRILHEICIGPSSDRILDTLSFLDTLVLRGVQLSCISAADVSLSGTGYSLLIGKSAYDGLKKVYVGYYLGCAAVESSESEYGKMEFCTIWITSRGLAAAPIGMGPNIEVAFIDNPFVLADAMGFYILSEMGLDEELSEKKVNVDAIVKEWEYKTSEDRLPIGNKKLAESNDTFTIGAAMLALQTLDIVYRALGMKGIDLLLYSVYKRAAAVRNLPIGRDRRAAEADGWGYEAWCSYVFETEDGEAVKDALYGAEDDVLQEFRELDASIASLYGLKKNNVYSFEDFTLYIPSLTEMVTDFFTMIIDKNALIERDENKITFEATTDFTRAVYAAEAIYCRSVRKNEVKLTGKELACSLSAFPKLKKLVDNIYNGMPVMDDAGSYQEKNSKREKYYDSVTDKDKYIELRDMLELHRDKQRFMEALNEDNDEEETLVGYERPEFTGDVIIDNLDALLPKTPPKVGGVRMGSFVGNMPFGIGI